MLRPDQHDTDKKGQALLRSFFANAGWEVTKIEEDYGRDFEIEVFRNNKTTGILFNVQLKSSEEPSYSAKNEFVSVELEIPNARYLAQELRTPTILVQADVTQQRLFWAAPQFDAALAHTLATKVDAQTCTVRAQSTHSACRFLESMAALRAARARSLSIENSADIAAASLAILI